MRTTVTQPHRYAHLDSARGIAALAVVFFHSAYCFSFRGVEFINVLCGRCPVLFFFILSGFVLGKSLRREKVLNVGSYAAFAARRFFRLYPALAVGLLASVLVADFLAVPASFMGTSNWYGDVIHAAKSVGTWGGYLREFLLVTQKLNIVVWSLYVEFVCSLLLPLIDAVVNRCQTWAVYFLLIFVGIRVVLDWCYPDEMMAMKYLFVFHIGYMISGIRDFSGILEKLPPVRYVVAAWTILFVWITHYSFTEITESILLGGFFVMLVPEIVPGTKWMVSKPFRTLGKCSYSLYLLHFPVLCLVLTLLQENWRIFFAQGPVVSATALFVIVFVATMPLAWLCRKFVEEPFDWMGHRLSALIYQRAMR